MMVIIADLGVFAGVAGKWTHYYYLGSLLIQPLLIFRTPGHAARRIVLSHSTQELDDQSSSYSASGFGCATRTTPDAVDDQEWRTFGRRGLSMLATSSN